jgi:hypothetical protein
MSWKSSEAKKKLREDIVEGVVTLQSDPRMVYNMRNGIYHRFLFENFRNNMRNLAIAVKKSKNEASRDEATLYNTLRQKPATAPPTYPPWHSSDARRLLLIDLANGTIAGMAPSAIRQTRQEYMIYTLKKFRDNYNKERNKPTIKAYWEFQRAEKERRKARKRSKKKTNNNNNHNSNNNNHNV